MKKRFERLRKLPVRGPVPEAKTRHLNVIRPVMRSRHKRRGNSQGREPGRKVARAHEIGTRWDTQCPPELVHRLVYHPAGKHPSQEAGEPIAQALPSDGPCESQ